VGEQERAEEGARRVRRGESGDAAGSEAWNRALQLAGDRPSRR